MRRIFVDKVNTQMILTGENHIHLSVVLRAKKGDTVVLCDNTGYDYIACIDDIKKNETILSVKESTKNIAESSIDTTLFFVPLKSDKNEIVVQKCTELGVKNFVPVISKYSQVKKEGIKIQRLSKIATQAAEQCGRGIVPCISESIKFIDLPSYLIGFDAVVFPYENAKGLSVGEFLLNQRHFSKTAIIIGGEGGFSSEEAGLLTEMNITPLTLGKRILRAETASIVVTSLVMNVAGQLK